jgi:hypothetical protein
MHDESDGISAVSVELVSLASEADVPATSPVGAVEDMTAASVLRLMAEFLERIS